MIRPEEALTLTEAAALMPGNPCRVTVWRWCVHGVNGVRLEHVRYGKLICTSHEALANFGSALAEANRLPEPKPKDKPQRPTPEKRRKSCDAAKRFLQEEGIANV